MLLFIPQHQIKNSKIETSPQISSPITPHHQANQKSDLFNLPNYSPASPLSNPRLSTFPDTKDEAGTVTKWPNELYRSRQTSAVCIFGAAGTRGMLLWHFNSAWHFGCLPPSLTPSLNSPMQFPGPDRSPDDITVGTYFESLCSLCVT